MAVISDFMRRTIATGNDTHALAEQHTDRNQDNKRMLGACALAARG
ncbi:hypothetical protein P3T37_004251 [Kitasatospora sp. MAA4]|nr:hypothetical protein [Kitasatospora sp. MAA4]MDH6134842.1 hypothetical protein [Kitasatospora sp. MAA4]